MKFWVIATIIVFCIYFIASELLIYDDSQNAVFLAIHRTALMGVGICFGQLIGHSLM